MTTNYYNCQSRESYIKKNIFVKISVNLGLLSNIYMVTNFV